jgi:hypothetical protein
MLEHVIPPCTLPRDHKNVGRDFRLQGDVGAADLDDEGREALVQAQERPGDDAKGAQAVESPV